MTLMACRDDLGRYTVPPMEGRPWQLEAKRLGLTQRVLSRMTGKPENTISRQMKGEHGPIPRYLAAIIIKWRDLTPAERDAWLAEVESASLD